MKLVLLSVKNIHLLWWESDFDAASTNPTFGITVTWLYSRNFLRFDSYTISKLSWD